MTKEEIIDIVMQIGMCDRPEDDSPALKMFISFAKLIAEKEREEFWNRIESKGDWTEYEKQMIEKAILKEREECAKICETYTDFDIGNKNSHAILIRARGQE